MIYEYAIQPEVLIEWAKTSRDYRECLREYGLGTPRIISIFPKQKVGKLRGYLLKLGPQDQDTSHGRRYLDLVVNITERIVQREIINNDVEHSKWKELVVLENEINKFDAIIADERLSSERNLTPSNMYDDGSTWEHSRQRSIRRTNNDLYEVLHNMLSLARLKIAIVDPYAYADESISFVSFMLNRLSETISPEFLPKIHVVFKKTRNSATLEHVKRQILSNLNFEFDGRKLTIKQLEQEEALGGFHNRYFLTEHACISLGHGFSLSGNVNEKDEIILFNKELYNDIENRFLTDF